MSTSAYIGQKTTHGEKVRRLNFDGDPETVLAALSQILQRDGFDLAADTILAHGEWRSLDPAALEDSGSDEYATVIGYGEIYLPDSVDPDEPDSDISGLDSEYVYLIDTSSEVVVYCDTDGGTMEWALGDDIPSSRDDE